MIFIHDTTSSGSFFEKAKSLTCVFWLVGAYTLVYYFSPKNFIEEFGLYVTYAFAALFSKVTLQV